MQDAKHDRRTALKVLAGLATAGLLPAARAQRYDEFKGKLFRIVVPFPAGMGSDNIARLIAQVLPGLTGASVIVENKPGGNNVIAVKYLNSLKPDGLALFLASQSPMAVNAVMYKSLGYDAVKETKPVALMMRTKWVVLGSVDSPHSTFMSHMEAARQSGSPLSASAGSSAYQLCLHLVAKAAGVKFNVVPYSGTPQALNDVIGGHVALTLVDTSTAKGPIDSGRLRPLLVIGDERFDRYPDAPSTAELKLAVPALSSWNGIFTTGTTPYDVRQRLAEVIRDVVASDTMKEYLARQGSQASFASVDAMQTLQIDQIAMYRNAMEAAGLQPQ